jgi:hypothetical protein
MGVRGVVARIAESRPGFSEQYRECGRAHWSLDITYREDESRVRERHLGANMAWLYRFTLSLLKQHPGRQSLVMKRRCCGWDINFLMEVLTGAKL